MTRAYEIRTRIAALETELVQISGLPVVEDLSAEAAYIATLCGACVTLGDRQDKEALAALAGRLAERLADRIDLLPRGGATK